MSLFGIDYGGPWPAAFNRFVALLAEAGTSASTAQISSIVFSNADTIEAGMHASFALEKVRLLKPEHLFVLLDSSKSLISRNLLQDGCFRRSGIQRNGAVLPLPTPASVATFLQSRSCDSAIMSFHVLGQDHLAVMIARFPGPNGEVMGIPGTGGVYYDFVFMHGLKSTFTQQLEQYALSVAKEDPDYSLQGSILDSLGSFICFLLWKPRPPRELFFIPHKLLHLLPLHAVSAQLTNTEVYLHDAIESISYASCIQDLELAGATLHIKGVEHQNVSRRPSKALYVLDERANLPMIDVEKRFLAAQLTEAVETDIITDLVGLPTDFGGYIYVNWSCHARSNSMNWGDSYLTLAGRRLFATTIMRDWNLLRGPIVMLSSCEGALDSSSMMRLDEYCGLDLAFRIAGARLVCGTLWPVDDSLAALTSMCIQAWTFQYQASPALMLTQMQRYLRKGAWKQFLLSDQQLAALPTSASEIMRDIREELRRLPDDSFSHPTKWAVFRSHGRL